jgi:alpha-D-ribose 1-methylphosphonate 5-triphosphate synthase subunit PhnI
MCVLRRVRSYAPGAVARVEAEASALFHLCLAQLALRSGQGRRALQPLLRALRTSPRALLLTQPHRTAMTIAGVLATLLPGNPARPMLTI